MSLHSDACDSNNSCDPQSLTNSGDQAMVVSNVFAPTYRAQSSGGIGSQPITNGRRFGGNGVSETVAGAEGSAVGEGNSQASFTVSGPTHTWSLGGALQVQGGDTGNATATFRLVSVTSGKVLYEATISTPGFRQPLGSGGEFAPGTYRIELSWRAQGSNNSGFTTTNNFQLDVVNPNATPTPTPSPTPTPTPSPTPSPSPTILWNNSAGGSFQTAENWNPQTVPTATNTARFNLLATYTVDVGSANTSRLELLSGDITFANAAYTIGSASQSPPGVVFDNVTLTLASGQLNSVAALIGRDFASRVNVHAGAVWFNTSTLSIGGAGNGFLAIASGGLVDSGNSEIGSGAGSGDVAVDGLNGEWRNDILHVGGGSAGSLTVDGGAKVVSDSAVVGFGANGTVSIQDIATTGTQSTWELQNLLIGNTGIGTVSVVNGGFLSTHGIVVNHGSSLTLRGVATSAGNHPSELRDLGEVTVEGTLLIENGAFSRHVFGDVNIGSILAGDVTVRGFNATTGASVMQGISDLTVGAGNQGTLTIESGAGVFSKTGVIGSTAASTGGVFVRGIGNGADSSWELKGDLDVGQAGNGVLEIRDGASVVLPVDPALPAISQPAVTAGKEATGTGTILVTGRSNLGPSLLSVARSLSVGLSGRGNLTVSNGGVVELLDGPMLVAQSAAGSTANVKVGGGGSLIDLKGQSGDLQMSVLSPTASVEITEGGTFACQDAFLPAFNANGFAQVRVGANGSGTPARFEVRHDLEVGVDGRGELVLNGGLVTVGGLTTVGAQGSILGNGTLSAPNRDVMIGGVVSPGLSPGRLTFESNYRQTADAKLKMQIAGTRAGEFDVLHVTGNATLDGTLEVTFLNGYLPRRGDTFRLLELDGSVTGAFARIVFPQLLPGFLFDTTIVAGGLQFTALNDAVRAHRAQNISTRMRVETADNVLIGGFILTGNDPKRVIIRAIGSSLSIPGKLANPTLELFGPSGLIASNDNWVDSPNRQEIIDTTIAPTNDLESAIVATLPAGGTGYTAIVRGANGTSGIGLVEVYELGAQADSELGNISSRGRVQTGDNVMIGGFIVGGGGGGTLRVIARGIGPSLTAFGIPEALQDPTLALHDGQGTLIASNDNWRTGGQEAEIIATTLPPTNDSEAAIVQTFAPGPYTAIVRGKNDTTGVALVEVYTLR
ncbi:MAG: hypothetical protein ABIR71_11350 [Chthoniobacterales bacterium]